MHERAAGALDFRCHYQLVEIAGAGREDLKILLEGVRRLGFAGINVTFPYKEAVVGLLDELSADAASIGAVNTIVVRDNRLIGHNTDTTGFARTVTPLVSASAQGAVALIGAGGVGKAIAFALAGLGVKELRIFDHEQPKATDLATRLESRLKTSVALDVEDALRGVVGVVNATPVDAAQSWHTGSRRAAASRTVGCGRRLFPALDAAPDRRQGKRRHRHDRARACDLCGR